MKTFEQLIDEAIKQNAGLIEFDGMNCNDYLEEDQEPCAGWDGESHRCSCGNRRVSWMLSDDKSYVYPEAH